MFKTSVPRLQTEARALLFFNNSRPLSERYGDLSTKSCLFHIEFRSLMVSQSALLLAAFLILSTISGWSQATTLDQTTRPVSPAEPIICNIASPYLGRPITEVSPDYPKRALKAKIQGDVVLDLAVSEEGKVVSVSVLSGDPELSREAAKALRNWEYLPDVDNSQNDIRGSLWSSR